MSWKNYDDVIDQLRTAGLNIDPSRFRVGSHAPIRCREFDGDREQRCWYWLNEIWLDEKLPDGTTDKACYIVGSFGIFRGNDDGKQKIKLSRKGPALTAEQSAAIRARQAEQQKRLKAMRAAEQQLAARKASAAWAKYLPTTDVPSEYLARKAVGAHGVRYSPSGNGTLAIPMCDAASLVWGLQIIRSGSNGRREKEYWPRGLAKQGHFHLIGSPRDVILLGEGYATCATLHEATGLPVAVAFDAGNLMPVANALHKAYPRAHILVCADDDYLTTGNPGVTAAMNAATAVSGTWVKPEFPSDREGKKLTDFNDLQHFPSGGSAAVRVQIEAALAEAGRLVPAKGQQAAARESTQGGGEKEGRRAESVMPIDDLVSRFMPVDDGTGDSVFDTWTHRIAKRQQMIALLPAGARADDIKRHPTWIDRGAFFIDEIGFDPACTDTSVKLNTWRGWPLKPKAGDCSSLISLLQHLCSEESNADEVFDWLICWMAYPLQHPGAKMSSAVIMHGPQGTGKSTIFQVLAKIYGEYATVLNQRGLEDKFNADWVDSKLFVLAEEVVTRAEMWHIKNELKELVTGDWIRVNPKNLTAYRQRNHINVVYLSNEGQPLPLDNDDRRHLVIYTPPALSEAIYDKVNIDLENGGVAAFYNYLLNVDLSAFHPKKRPPMTVAKQKLIDLSLPSEAVFLREWMLGRLELDDDKGPLPFCPCTGRQLHTAYARWARQTLVQRPRDETQFIGFVGRQQGWEVGKSCMTYERIGSTVPKTRKMVIPSEQALADALLAGAVSTQREGKNKAQWLTSSFFMFQIAMETTQ